MNIEYYFSILELPVTNDLEVVKARFRSLMKKYHPDVCKDIESEAKAKKISEAYFEIKKYINANQNQRPVNNANQRPTNKEREPKYTQENYNQKREQYYNEQYDYSTISDELKEYLKILSLSLRTALIKYREFCCFAKKGYYEIIELKDFIKYLVKEKRYISYLKIDERILKDAYYAENEKSENKLYFDEWLEIKVREKKAMTILNMDSNFSVTKYNHYLHTHAEKLSFVDWLEACVKEKKLISDYLTELQMDYQTAWQLYNRYYVTAISNKYLALTFIEWLEVQKYDYSTIYGKAYKKV